MSKSGELQWDDMLNLPSGKREVITPGKYLVHLKSINRAVLFSVVDHPQEPGVRIAKILIDPTREKVLAGLGAKVACIHKDESFVFLGAWGRVSLINDAVTALTRDITKARLLAEEWGKSVANKKTDNH